LTTYTIHVEKIPKDIQYLVIKDLLILHKTSHYITSANEATRSEFISRIIYGIASLYDGEVKVFPQYEIAGSHGKGTIDWAIKMADTIILVTEAKKRGY